MKTFKQFIEEAYIAYDLNELARSFGQIKPDVSRQNLEDIKDLRRMGRRARLRTSSIRTSTNPSGTRFSPETRANVNAANLNDLMNKWNKEPASASNSTTSGGRIRVATPTGAVGTTGAASGTGLAAAAAPVTIGLGLAAAQGEIAQRQQVAGTRRATGALPGERVGLNPSLIRKDFKRDVIQDKGGAGGKVSTNTGYVAKLGGAEGTLTRGSGGQKMLRVGEGKDGLRPSKPAPVSIFKPNTWFKPTPGVGYESKLGGVRGTVTYDQSGRRTFSRYIPNKN